ncbi:unnamed protein product [Angiostrongylus costaricensis]|uniref:Triacylglycerol lipase n=1 Tax=Angiostrongylus costaricensis TaxID=334426 RepID=A0A0R3PWL2_ANGCS|nr:unnamed protein product [Angiostrongylus costaricensis]
MFGSTFPENVERQDAAGLWPGVGPKTHAISRTLLTAVLTQHFDIIPTHCDYDYTSYSQPMMPTPYYAPAPLNPPPPVGLLTVTCS